MSKCVAIMDILHREMEEIQLPLLYLYHHRQLHAELGISMDRATPNVNK